MGPLALVSDRWTVQDVLDRSDFCDVIADIVLGAETPFVLAVYGEWGSGKTSLMKLVRQRLRGPVVNSKIRDLVKTVWFDLWEHQDDEDPVVALLQTARDTMHVDAPDKKVWEKVTGHLKTITRALGNAKVEIGGAPVKAGAGGYYDIWRSVKAERFEVQEERVRLREEFRRVIGLYLPGSSLESEPGQGDIDVDYVRRELDELDPSAQSVVPGGRRIVFFIDNLDRCNPDVAVDLLEKIQTFLSLPGCVFVLGLDESAILRTIGHKFRWFDDTAEESEMKVDRLADHYLEKIVQYAFRVPPVGVEDYKKFVLGLQGVQDNKKADGSTARSEEATNLGPMDILSTALTERHASLRLAKSTVNAFRVNDRLGRKRAIRKGFFTGSYDETVMAVITALQQLHTNVYRSICRDSTKRADHLHFLFAGVPANPGEGPEAQAMLEQAERALFGTGQVGQDGLSRSQELVKKARQFWMSLNEQEQTKLLVDLPHYVELAGQALAEPEPPPAPIVSSGEVGWLPPLPLQILSDSAGDGSLAGAREAVKSGATRLRLGSFVWRVLERQGNQALLLSEYPVARGPFHERFGEVTWQGCSLRRWLNTEFRDAFVSSLGVNVDDVIVPEPVSNGSNPVWGTPGDDSPRLDQVFLLSMEEAAAYLAPGNPPEWPQYRSREYFVDSRLQLTDASGAPCWWWLRSPGGTPNRAASVGKVGYVGDNGLYVSNDSGAVRPALWFNLGS
jgi:hypothetical protein